jgi:hypothetical protein
MRGPPPALNAARRLDGTIDRGLENTLFSPYPVGPACRLALARLKGVSFYQ